MTYDVLLTRKADKYIARVRQWPEIVVEGDSEEEVLRKAQADLKSLLVGGTDYPTGARGRARGTSLATLCWHVC